MENITAFVRKLQQQMGKAPKKLARKVRLETYGEEISLESLTEEDMDRINLESFEGRPEIELSRAVVFEGSPTIRAAAAKLVELGAIDTAPDIMRPENKLFRAADVVRMAQIVTELTDAYNQPQVEEVESLKNS